MKRALIVAIALAGCRGGRTDGPKRTDAILYPHDFHAKMEFDCDTCHKGITEANDLTKSFLPREATCLECHAEKKQGGECGFCHADPKHPMTYEPRRALAATFPHARHKDAPCATCHTKLPEPNERGVTRADHEGCTACHSPHGKQYAAGSCETCHDDLGRFPVAPVASFSHQGDFVRTHGFQARTSAETCAKCHDQTSCSECHAKTVATRVEVKYPDEVLRTFIHRGDYVSRHSLEARADSTTCARCHGQSFCESCHTLNNLTTAATGPRMPHPPGFGVSHGAAARNDIASCASCHDQGAASVCVKCHQVGGVGGNPHPASWLSRHDSAEIAKNGMCAACHR